MEPGHKVREQELGEDLAIVGFQKGARRNADKAVK
jgi:hypothetical protein